MDMGPGYGDQDTNRADLPAYYRKPNLIIV